MPNMRQSQSPMGCYERLKRKVSNVRDDDDELLDALDTPAEIPTDAEFTNLATATENFQSPPSDGKKLCGSIAKKVTVILLTNVIASVVIMLISVTIGGVMGYAAFRNGTVQIDKTVKAFTIPNHIASRRQDALEVAIKDMRNNRYKRDVLWRTSDFEESQNDLEGNHENEFVEVFSDTKSVHRISKRELRQKLRKSLEHSVNKGDLLEGHHRQKRRTNKKDEYGRIYGITQSNRRWKMQLVYLAQGEDNNMFTPERLETVRQVERAVMDHKDFVNFCYIQYSKLEQDPNLGRYRGCSPLNSLLTYFYPSQATDGRVHYDSLGHQLNDINKTLSLAMTHDSFFWYVDENISNTNRRSRILRSEVHFGAPLPYYESYYDQKSEQQERYTDFVLSYIDILSKLSTDKVKVLYGGNEIFDYEVDTTFWNDVRLAVFTLGFIVIFMFVLTSFSIWLTLCGIVAILLSFPVALFFYVVVFSVESLGILNGAAAFVIIGIGVDDVFVFINTFRQSYALQDHYQRMVHTIKTAGSATFFTSFTTAAAFAANVASSIPAVHDFGLFMSLIVAGCWLTVVSFIPPAINIWAKCFAKCESCCYSGCAKCKAKTAFSVPSDMNAFLQHSVSTSSTSSGISSYSSLPSPSSQESPASAAVARDAVDVPMLSIDDVSSHEGGWPIYLGMLNQMLLEDDDPLVLLENDLNQQLDGENLMTQEGCGLTSLMQAFLYNYVGKPVVKIRWFILGAYLVILAISVGLMTQLTPATKPPQLFKPTTNLQMLVNLAANFSDDSITCDDCSGFYKEGSVRPEPRKTPRMTSTLSTVSIATVFVPAGNKPGVTPGGNTNAASPTSTVLDGSSATASSKTPPQPNSSPTSPTATLNQPSPGELTTPGSSTTTSRGASRARTKTSSSTTPAQFTEPLSPTFTDKAYSVVTPRPAPSTQAPRITGKSTPPSWTPPKTDPDSIAGNYDPCANNKCKDIKKRPNLETGAVIYVVFGIIDIDRSNVSYKHVLTDKGQVTYDNKFYMDFNAHPAQAVADMCRICKAIANNSELVRPNSSQCLPPYGLPQSLRKWLTHIQECRDLPEPVTVSGRHLPARAIAGKDNQGYLKWIAMAFESTTFKGQSYFTAYSEYQKWEKFMKQIKTTVIDKGSPLQSVYQTSEFWESVMMEIVTVSSATYGLVLSLVVCMAAIAIFTAHVQLLLVVLFTIVGVICLVVSIFYLAGWEMGAVEAVSLSILVGSSVDYCVHLVEGFLLSGKNIPPNISQDKKECRKWRALAAVSHIGVSITSSAITTIVAAIPLCMTVIQPFSKFGQIVTINTSISILYTLTACVAFLSLMGPAKFRVTWRSYVISFIITSAVIGSLVLVLYIISKSGVDIPSPSGQNLFR